MANSTMRPGSRKPHKNFPLTLRKSDGRWCKKVRGKIHYFTGTADEALAEWLRIKDDLLAGRTPRPTGEGFTVEDLCDHFLNAKKPFVASGELTQRSYDIRLRPAVDVPR